MLGFTNIGSAADGSLGYPRWNPPTGGLVQRAKDAIAIARTVWIAAHPDTPVGDEQAWEMSMAATLHGDTWEVAQKIGPGVQGGGPIILISKTDGRIDGIYMTQ